MRRIRLNEFKDVKKILVIKLRHIGDVLLTVPAIRALKESFPRASVSVLVNSGTEDMLTLNPLVTEVIEFDRSLKRMALTTRTIGELKFIKDLRGRNFDMTVDLTGGDRPALTAYLTGARYRLGYDPGGAGFAGKKYLYTHLVKRPAGRLHTVKRDLGLVREFGIDTSDLTVDIYTPVAEDLFVKKLLAEKGVRKGEPFVHVHPTSRWFFKCWADDYMAMVIDSIQAHGVRAVITAAPDERELKRVSFIISLMKSAPIDLSGKLNLKQLAALSRSAVLFFGVDSAPMHMAAACDTPVVAVFGPSGVFDWGPWDNKAANAGQGYQLKNGVQRFGENVAIQKDWDCVPCGKDGCKGTKKSDCLEALGPPEVWEILKERLDRAVGGPEGGR